MAYWVKIIYDRETYLIDLKRISTFCFSVNSKIKLWLPDSRKAVIIHPQTNPEDYQKILEYIKQVKGESLDAYWVKVVYDREEYLIDLNRVQAFVCTPGSEKITFWLPDSGNAIIIHPQSNPEDYSKIVQYIEKITGYSMP